jgi:hypothetical protein
MANEKTYNEEGDFNTGNGRTRIRAISSSNDAVRVLVEVMEVASLDGGDVVELVNTYINSVIKEEHREKARVSVIDGILESCPSIRMKLFVGDKEMPIRDFYKEDIDKSTMVESVNDLIKDLGRVKDGEKSGE